MELEGAEIVKMEDDSRARDDVRRGKLAENAGRKDSCGSKQKLELQD